MINDMVSNKELSPIVIELFIRGRKLNLSLVFFMLLYFAVPKNIRLNSKNYFLVKIPDKRELQQIAFNQILTYIKNVLQNHILFWLLILSLRQTIPHFS